MRDDKRACFALIAATIVNKRRYVSVYDFTVSKHISLSVSGVESNYLSFFDYNRGGYVSGNSESLYDYPTSSFVSLNKRGNTISCYDYETGSFVDFTVSGYGISAYDYQLSTFYNYNVN